MEKGLHKNDKLSKSVKIASPKRLQRTPYYSFCEITQPLELLLYYSHIEYNTLYFICIVRIVQSKYLLLAYIKYGDDEGICL